MAEVLIECGEKTNPSDPFAWKDTVSHSLDSPNVLQNKIAARQSPGARTFCPLDPHLEVILSMQDYQYPQLAEMFISEAGVLDRNGLEQLVLSTSYRCNSYRSSHCPKK